MNDPPTASSGVSAVDTTVLTFSNSASTATLASTEVREYTLPVPDGTVSFRGQLIGYASSHRIQHRDHRDGTGHAQPREKCPACRWFEVRIFRVDASDPRAEGRSYAVHTQGPTTVPGEYVKCRLVFAVTGYEVLELLTVRRPDDVVFMPAASSRALAQAAGLDTGIETAYVNRAVA